MKTDNETYETTIIRGDSALIPISNYTDGILDLFPVDSTIIFAIKRSPKETAYTLCKKALIREDGTAVILLTPQETAELTPRRYVYDLEYSNADRSVVSAWINNAKLRVLENIANLPTNSC